LSFDFGGLGGVAPEQVGSASDGLRSKAPILKSKWSERPPKAEPSSEVASPIFYDNF